MPNQKIEGFVSNLKTDCSLPKFKVTNKAAAEKNLQSLANEAPERINWAGSILGIPDVWSVTQGEGAKVAILDTGIDSDHQDLANAIADEIDFTGDGIEDENGHGTHCAGIVGARLNGVAWGSSCGTASSTKSTCSRGSSGARRSTGR